MYKITFTNAKINTTTDLVVGGNRLLLLDRKVVAPAMILTFHVCKAELWFANAERKQNSFPKASV